MKIAIIHCRKSSEVCTGAGCINAFNKKSSSFEQYKGIETELCAFMDCGGCNIDRKTHKGMIEKMDRLKSMNVDKIHIGVCINEKCPHFINIIEMLDRYKIVYEFGTHPTSSKKK